MFKIFVSMTILSVMSFAAHAALHTQKYSSIAMDDKKQVVYREQHEVIFENQRVQRATTQYFNPEGKIIGVLVSDFTKLVTIPEYEYKDLRAGSSHGIKLDGEKITLWNKEKDHELEESKFSKKEFDEEALIVGCQGLHYYLIENLDQLKAKKSISVKYFIPGKLDYYSFTLKIDREDEEYIYLKLSIDSLILKIFTSSLNLKYSKAKRRLVQYTGLSNIPNDAGKMQNVSIDYSYE